MTDIDRHVMDIDIGSELSCPIGSSLDVLGQKWTLLIVRDAMRGLRRFTEFQQALGCPRNLLAARLRMLCEHGILRQVAYSAAGQRQRVRYELTSAGRELAPTLIALYDWGVRHVRLGAQHQHMEPSSCACGAALHVTVECEHGHRQPTPEGITFPALVS